MRLEINGFNIWMIIIATFLTSFVLTFISKKLAVHVNAMDIPNERKVHKKPMPRLGGLAIYGAFLIGYILYGILSTQMVSILIGSFILLLLGICDDIKPMSALPKFLVQIIVAVIVVFYGKLYFNDISLFGNIYIFPTIVNQLLSVFFIMGAINAINLIDGLDGLCAGVSTIYFITIAIIAFVLNRLSGLDVILCLIMIGATAGFLVHNFPPAKTFMGDTGSTFLGFMIAIIALLGYKVATLTSLFTPIIILAIPIFDTTLAILRRLIKHQSIGIADKEHFHHQVLKLKFSPRVTILIIYAISISFSLVSILFSIGDNKLALMIYTVLLLFFLILVLKTDILFNHKKRRDNNEED